MEFNILVEYMLVDADNNILLDSDNNFLTIKDMTKVKSTKATAIKIAKPKFIIVQPWESSVSKGNADAFSFADVLKDSTSVTQDDPSTEEIENELSDDPIRSNVTLGTRNFSCTLEDIQKDILAKLGGFEAGTSGKVYAPASYSDIFAEVAIVLDAGGGNYTAIVLPKVQINAKILLESLSSSMVGVQIQGACLTADIVDGAKTFTTAQYIDYNYSLPTITTNAE